MYQLAIPALWSSTYTLMCSKHKTWLYSYAVLFFNFMYSVNVISATISVLSFSKLSVLLFNFMYSVRVTFAATSALCLIYNLPGPPILQVQNFSFALYPIDTELCSNIDGNKYITFNLYTQLNPNTPQIIVTGDDSSLTSSNFNFSNPTVLFFHGFTESIIADDSQVIRRSYLERGDYNVIITDAKKLLAGLYYFEAANNCRFVGQFAALLVDYLVQQGLNLEDFHVIGFSLGAHIAGFVGQYVTAGNLSRITGLDPAGPLFYTAGVDDRLDPTDANFVDIIHSNRYIFGYVKSLGHVDFFPNGGGPSQPGCSLISRTIDGSLNEFVFCEHYRAFRLYAKSLNDPYRYPATQCTSYTVFQTGLCALNDVQYMGIAVDTSATGDYYITTGTDAADLH